MREIKFRAWDGKEMHLPDFSDDGDFVIWPDGSIKEYHEVGYERHLLSFNRSGWVIMQYTGLKDKNGKEIYEGDIIPEKIFIDCDRSESTIICNDIHQKTIMAPHVVTFIRESCEYKLVNNDYNTKTPFWAFYKRSAQSEVIGNIHENPELLNQ